MPLESATPFLSLENSVARPTASTTPRHPGNHPPSAGHPSSENAISATNNQDELLVAAKIYLPIVEPTDEDSIIGSQPNFYELPPICGEPRNRWTRS